MDQIKTNMQFRVPGALAHGTTERHLEAILRGGLRPRKNRPSLWTEHPSVAANVYLTTAYALYFARFAAENGEAGLLIEVDPNRLKTANLFPDEDAVAQVISGDTTDPRFKGVSLADATADVRNNLRRYRAEGYSASWSMVALGTCAHEGLIPVQAIKRIVRVEKVTGMDIVAVSDPTITVMNYRYTGADYRALQSWFLSGGEGPMPMRNDLTAAMPEEHARQWRQGMAEVEERLRANLTVVYERGRA